MQGEFKMGLIPKDEQVKVEDGQVKGTIHDDESKLLELSKEELAEEIRKVRKEAASKRVENKTIKEQLEILATKTKELENIAKEKDSVVSQLEKLKEDAQLANASEIEKLQHILEKKEKLIQERDGAIKLAERELEKKESVYKERVIRDTALEVIIDKGYKFKNTYEREGFLNSVVSRKTDGSYKTDEEVKEIAESFLSENFVAPDSVPPAPNGNKKAAPNAREQLDALMAQKKREPYNRELTGKINALIKQITEADNTPKKRGIFRNSF